MTPGDMTRGYGVGLRTVHYPHLLTTPSAAWGVDWFEALTEDFFGGRGPMLEHVRAARPVTLHGVSLNIGSTDPLDTAYLRQLAELIERIDPVWVSDHLCWTGVGGITSHDLWPVPLTAQCLAHIVTRVHAVQEHLGRQLILENPSSYLEWQSSEMQEWEFLAELVARTGCGLLLDVNNVHVSATNHGWDPAAYIRGLPAAAIAYLHIAGHTQPTGTYLLDTHDRPVANPVWGLYALAQQHTGGVATLLEWDADIPPWAELVAELAKAP
jgi:hypothetical protein